jgi:hypothetical protein
VHPLTGSNSAATDEMTPLACDMTAIPSEQRASHAASAARLLNELSDEMVTLANGYAFRFPPDDLTPVADFVNRERLCCPFLGFTIEVSPAGGPMWLCITGREGVKEFLAAELSIRAPSETGKGWRKLS